ncbi:MAG TPA: hypothetical protein O0W79_00355 [Methanocorpusculum sp.]|nr:hypothetical protein [Methanocorpusculum sp.]
MGLLGKLKETVFSESGDVKTTAVCASLRMRIETLKHKEETAITRLGYEVMAHGDAQKYGETGEEVLRIQEEISRLQRELLNEEIKLRL